MVARIIILSQQGLAQVSLRISLEITKDKWLAQGPFGDDISFDRNWWCIISLEMIQEELGKGGAGAIIWCALVDYVYGRYTKNRLPSRCQAVLCSLYFSCMARMANNECMTVIKTSQQDVQHHLDEGPAHWDLGSWDSNYYSAIVEFFESACWWQVGGGYSTTSYKVG